MSSGGESEENKATVLNDKPILRALLQNPTGKDATISSDTSESRISSSTLERPNISVPDKVDVGN